MQKELSPFLDALASSCCGRRRLKNSFPEAAEMACIRKTAALGNRFKREPRIAEQRSGKLESVDSFSRSSLPKSFFDREAIAIVVRPS
jgi:hypothetical protein